jgi:EAL domain-containing protein (putative c-di-GMP-specific phosphodiesterase class I)
VIAEGVELQAQADFLAQLGCHAFQGYLFSKPLSLDALEALVLNRRRLARFSGVQLPASGPKCRDVYPH